jgi:hypothetical protein
MSDDYRHGLHIALDPRVHAELRAISAEFNVSISAMLAELSNRLVAGDSYLRNIVIEIRPGRHKTDRIQRDSKSLYDALDAESPLGGVY